MRVTHLEIKNWRNFKSVDIDLADRVFIVGPNASGKSNLLDGVRFLRDLVVDGGGLQQALKLRGGLPRVRNLAARNFNHGHVEFTTTVGDDDRPDYWTYRLAITTERAGRHRPVVTLEEVWRDGEIVLTRPGTDDMDDPERLTQTAIEQVNLNREFRELVEFFSSVRYLHLVPQVIRDPDRAGDRDDDPFGGDFLLRLARTPERSRAQRLDRISDALRSAVPQLQQLELVRDVDGRPHLQARYQHWRVQGARQDERDFSDGTLRLIGLLWILSDTGKGTGPVLLEEPELSLHASVVQRLPSLLSRAQRASKRQVLLTTHAGEVMADPGLGLDEVVALQPGDEGTVATLASDLDDVEDLLGAGMTLAEILRPVTQPEHIEQLRLLQL